MQGLNSPPPALDDALVRRALAGDVQAFGDLYLACLPAVYRYIQFRVGDESLAQDVTELTFLRAWEARGRYRPGATPILGWLYRIARNAVIDHYRTARSSLPLDPGLADGEADVAHAAERHEERRRLVALVERLGSTDRDVLTMRFVLGMSHIEVAAELKRSPGSIRIIQYRALRKLRRWLQEADRHAD
jgi:RNA polymerase sigma-70 factor, ECF subfamily